MRNQIKRLFVLALSFLMVCSLSACGGSGGNKEAKPVRIVQKNFTEQRILGPMLSIYLESKGFETSVKELGGSMLCFNALKNDDADLYAEYTGTGYSSVLKQTEILTADETYDYVKSEFEEQFGITWLRPMGFNNTYVLTLRPDTIDEYGLKVTSDLKPYAKDLLIGGSNEFAVREDGYPKMQDVYGFSFKDFKTMDIGLTYRALLDDEIQVVPSLSTDGRIAKYNLVNLEDDQHIFPPYYCTPIIRMDFAEANPDVIDTLNELENRFTNEDMQKYNLMVEEGGDTQEVATQMLTDKGLI